MRPQLYSVTMFFDSHVLWLKAGHYTILCNHLDSFPVDEYRLHFPACFQVPLTYFHIHMTFSFRSPPLGLKWWRWWRWWGWCFDAGGCLYGRCCDDGDGKMILTKYAGSNFAGLFGNWLCLSWWCQSWWLIMSVLLLVSWWSFNCVSVVVGVLVALWVVCP